MTVDYGSDNLNELIERLKLRLKDYLVITGTIPAEADDKVMFKCINPAHDDKNPSAGLVPCERTQTDKPILFKCWPCGITGSIFKAAAILEDKPSEGADWVTDNVYYLADLLSEPHDKIEFTVDHERVKILQLYNDAADCLVGLCKTSEKFEGYKHTLARGLTKDICAEYGVGTVEWQEFFETLQRYGPWDPQFILDNNITQNHFSTEYITITLKDHKGQVVAFDRRYINYVKDDELKAKREKKFYPPKFSNSATSANEKLKKIYKESPFLYGFDKCSKLTWKRLDIFEGYFDVLAAAQNGHVSAVGSCGTSTLKDEHFDMLSKLGFSEIAIVMDNDSAGKKASETCLEKFGKRADIRLSFVELYFNEADHVPEKDKDPDTFFRMYGMKQYLIMPVHSAFSFLMTLEKERGLKAEELARKVIPQLASEPDAIKRGQQIRDLARHSGLHEDDIRQEVDKIRSGSSKIVLRDMNKALERAGTDPSKVKAIIKDAVERMDKVTRDNVDLLSDKAAIGNFHKVLDEFDNDQQILSGWKTGINLFDDRLSGFRKRNYMVIGGNANTGKSAALHKLLNGLLHYDAKDQNILLFSLDDPIGMSIAKQISVETNMPIEWCATPAKFITSNPERAKKYMKAREFYRNHIPHRLRIFGGEAGSSMSTITSAIRRTEDETGRHVIVAIDSFHLIHGEGMDEERAKFEKISEKLHALAHGGTTVIITAECKKEAQGRRPNQGDLAETRGLLYDTNIIGMIYNDVHEKRNKEKHRKNSKPEFFTVAKDEVTKEWVQEEVVQFTIEKNKTHGGHKGHAFFKLKKGHANLEEIPNPQEYFAQQQEKWNSLGFGGQDEVMEDPLFFTQNLTETRNKKYAQTP